MLRVMVGPVERWSSASSAASWACRMGERMLCCSSLLSVCCCLAASCKSSLPYISKLPASTR